MKGEATWEKLSLKIQCRWMVLSIVPSVLGEMLQDKDDEKSRRVMEALLKMEKIDIKTLKQAYEHQ